MPIINVRYPAGSLDKPAKKVIAKLLNEALITMEGGAGTYGGEAFAWVLFTEIAEEDWWVGGVTSDEFVAPPGRFLVYVTIPEGYMNAAHKTQVHEMVTAAIVKGVGTVSHTPPNSHLVEAGSILVVIEEVSEGNWGAGGRTISLDNIAESVGLPKDGERFAWVRSYFDAKGRQYEAAGYPPDAAGLLPSTAAHS